MPDLLIELFSEEIPARMQARARDDLKRLVTDGLVEAGLTYAAAHALVDAAPAGAGRRRADVRQAGRSARSARARRVDAPEAALQGFLRATGLTLDQLERRAEAKKAQVWFAVDRDAGPRRRRHRRRGARGRDPQLPLAEVDALGRGLLALGAALAIDPVHPDR